MAYTAGFSLTNMHTLEMCIYTGSMQWHVVLAPFLTLKNTYETCTYAS